jgi:hypothetical protein
MAHVLSITDGSSTITLTTTNYYLSAYTPGVPRLDRRTGQYTSVTEAVDLLVYSTTTTDIQTKINDIENMLARARRRQRIGHGSDRIYLQFKLDGESDTYRSEILDGAVEVSLEGIGAWVNKNIPVRLNITRRFFWETATEKTAGSGSIDNDGGYVALSSLDGTEPAPAKIEMTNNSGSGKDYGEFYLANLVSQAPSSFDHHYGSDQAYSLTAGGTDDIDYTIDSGTNSQGRGRYFNVLTNLSNVTLSTQDVMVKAIIRDSTGLVTLFETDEVRVSPDSLTNVGAVPIPPGGDYTSWDGTQLRLTFRSINYTGSGNVELMQLQPSEQLRHIEQKGLSIPNGSTVVDDQIEGVTRAVGSDIYVARGALMLWPGESQRVLFAWDEAAGGYDSSDTLSVSIKYRPRRLSV